jgi:ribosomal protein L11 methyltransferase
MSWQEITFELRSAQVVDFEDALMSLGALSITLRDAADQPILEPPPAATPVWDRVLLTAMFEGSTDPAAIADELSALLKLPALPRYQVDELQDREWRRTWMDYFRPMQFGERLWICPSGYEPPSGDDDVVVDLDPGLAFGTGSHPTTALCMQWLDQQDLRDKVVVDFGCGSGVLAIAAAKLGAKVVYAIDNDPQALQATLANAQHNSVQDIVQICEAESVASESVDILIANILLKPLLQLRDELARMLVPGGEIVLSGLLGEQRQALEDAYRQQFTFDACETMQEWVRLSAVRH